MLQETDMILEEALRLVQLGWCRENLAEDAGGEYVDPGCADAVAWCATGALLGAMDRLGFDCLDTPRFLRAVHRVARAAGVEDDDWEMGLEVAVMTWNDRQDTAEDVILVFKRSLAG